MSYTKAAPSMGGSLAVGIAAVSYLLADWLGAELLGFSRSPISPVLLATVVGAIVGNVWSFDDQWQTGFRFCASTVLKTGVVFLGLRLSLATAGDIGLQALPIVAVSIVTALFVVLVVGQRMGLSWRLAGLIAAGTSICGCTAIVAVAPLIRSRPAETSYAIGTITLFGLIAMFSYPYLANFLFAADDALVGLFLGSAIHETAQVAGAGFIYSQIFDAPAALDVATVTKLIRNLSMVLIIPLIGALSGRFPTDGTVAVEQSWFKAIPVFIVGFATMSVVRTVGDSGHEAFGVLAQATWRDIVASSTAFAELCLVIAMAGIGLTTNISKLAGLGFKPFALGFFAAAVVGAASYWSICLTQL